jgi:hypothetical protein
VLSVTLVNIAAFGRTGASGCAHFSGECTALYMRCALLFPAAQQSEIPLGFGYSDIVTCSCGAVTSASAATLQLETRSVRSFNHATILLIAIRIEESGRFTGNLCTTMLRGLSCSEDVWR